MNLRIEKKAFGVGFTLGPLYQEDLKELRTIGFSSFPAHFTPGGFAFPSPAGDPEGEKGVAPMVGTILSHLYRVKGSCRTWDSLKIKTTANSLS